MSDEQKQAIRSMLAGMAAPGGGDVVSRGMVSDIFVTNDKAFFSLTVPAREAERFEPFRREAEARARALPGLKGAMVALTAERLAGGPPTPRPAPAHDHRHAHAHSHAPAAAPSPPRAATKPGIPGVERIVAVASGKGGVGKSTTAVNLALACAALGLKVGILDADIYGPSIPRLLDLKGRPGTVDGRRLVPLEAYGLRAMSMGLLVEEETPMIWRGPMVMSALTQMLRDVEWGTLDLLVVDMPPGTGDAQLTMAQAVPLAGAVIVSTPQDLALIDARKGLAMFRKVEVPVLGIVENMSYFVAPDTGARYDIFGHGGARREANRLGVPFLGEVPLEMAIRESSDSGRPVVAVDPGGPHATAYFAIARAMLGVMEANATGAGPAPRIVFE